MNSHTTLRTKSRRRKSERALSRPALRFSPSAWAKLLFLRDCGPTEVGGFGISAADDPLLVEDVRLVRQTCSHVTVEFEDAAVADFFDEQVDLGLFPERFARIWIHTHPGMSPTPSGTDEHTFARVFGGCDWAIMAILACGGATYARLRFAAGPGGELQLPVEVDFSSTFAASEQEFWREEYAHCVTDADAIEHGAEQAAGPRHRSRLRHLAAAADESLLLGVSPLGFHDSFNHELWEYAGEYGF